jgi:hypothetical protein
LKIIKPIRKEEEKKKIMAMGIRYGMIIIPQVESSMTRMVLVIC